MPPKMQSPPLSNANPPAGAPAGYYERNLQCIQMMLNLPMMTPIIMRHAPMQLKPMDLLFVASAPNSYSPEQIVMSEPGKELVRSLRDLPADLHHVKEKKVGVMFLRSIPNLASHPVIACDSDDPATAANVATNVADLKTNLMAPGCVLSPLGQAAWNVLKRYNLPAALMADGKCMPDWSRISKSDLVTTLRRLGTTSPQ